MDRKFGDNRKPVINDISKCMRMLTVDPLDFILFSEEEKEDRNIALEALILDHRLYNHISQNLKDDRDFIITVLRCNPKLIELLNESFTDDLYIMIIIVSQDGCLFRFASTRLRNNILLASIAIRSCRDIDRLTIDLGEQVRLDRKVLEEIRKKKTSVPSRFV